MKTIVGNLWDFQTEVKVIPTNGVVTRTENDPMGYKAIMGAGVAKQASTRSPYLIYILGDRLQKYGNRVFVYDVHYLAREIHRLGCTTLVTLPTKEHWKDHGGILLFSSRSREWHLAALGRAAGRKRCDGDD